MERFIIGRTQKGSVQETSPARPGAHFVCGTRRRQHAPAMAGPAAPAAPRAADRHYAGLLHRLALRFTPMGRFMSGMNTSATFFLCCGRRGRARRAGGRPWRGGPSPGSRVAARAPPPPRGLLQTHGRRACQRPVAPFSVSAAALCSHARYALWSLLLCLVRKPLLRPGRLPPTTTVLIPSVLSSPLLVRLWGRRVHSSVACRCDNGQATARTAPKMAAKSPINVCVTGAAGQIAYSLLFSVSKGDVFGMDQVKERTRRKER